MAGAASPGSVLMRIKTFENISSKSLEKPENKDQSALCKSEVITRNQKHDEKTSNQTDAVKCLNAPRLPSKVNRMKITKLADIERQRGENEEGGVSDIPKYADNHSNSEATKHGMVNVKICDGIQLGLFKKDKDCVHSACDGEPEKEISPGDNGTSSDYVNMIVSCPKRPLRFNPPELPPKTNRPCLREYASDERSHEEADGVDKGPSEEHLGDACPGIDQPLGGADGKPEKAATGSRNGKGTSPKDATPDEEERAEERKNTERLLDKITQIFKSNKSTSPKTSPKIRAKLNKETKEAIGHSKFAITSPVLQTSRKAVEDAKQDAAGATKRGGSRDGQLGSTQSEFVSRGGVQDGPVSLACPSVDSDCHRQPDDAFGNSSEDDDGWEDEEFSDEESTEELRNESSGGNRINKYETLKKEKKKVMEEIVSTEIHYVNKLYLLNKTVWQIEGANMCERMFNASEINVMFPCVEALYRLHAEHMLPAMRNIMDEWSSDTIIYPLWQKYQPYLTMYKSYMGLYDEAVKTVEHLRTNCPEFSNVLSQIEDKPEFGNLAVTHYLLEPIQRLGRYKLLLERYQKRLPNDDKERKNLKDVIEDIDHLLMDCQKQMSAKDSFTELQKIQENFEEHLTWLSPTAELLNEGQIVQICESATRKQVERYIFLFSEYVLVCRKRLSGKYRIIYQLDIDEIEVVSLDPQKASPSDASQTIQLKNSNRTITITFRDRDAMSDWKMDLYAALNKKAREKQLRRTNKAPLD